jgi:hypothetical protein
MLYQYLILSDGKRVIRSGRNGMTGPIHIRKDPSQGCNNFSEVSMAEIVDEERAYARVSEAYSAFRDCGTEAN